MTRPRIVYLATDPVTAYRFMDGQLAYMREQGFHVALVTAPGQLLQEVARREGVEVHPIRMRRDISAARDVLALAELTLLLRRLRPHLINAGTPKAGLLGVLAGRLARVPVVVYLARGLRFEGARGATRLLLAGAEHVCGALSHRVFCNSSSLQNRFVALACSPLEKTFVPANGTSNGVDVERFEKTPQALAWAGAARDRLGIPKHAFVAGFVGRLARDKGITELLEAFSRFVEVVPNAHLLLVGDHDPTDPLPASTLRLLEASNVTVTGFVPEPGPYYAIMDVLVFPSFREGFPNVPLEAAAAGVPCVAFRATGTVDAVADGSTGLLVPLGDARALADAMARYATDRALLERHAEAARIRVGALFRREMVWSAIADEYRRLLGGVSAGEGYRGEAG